jgi:serine/threonine protein kinase
MAKIVVLGPFEGPGERKTVETLGEQLPSDWMIFSGRKLPGRDRDDVDLIIVGRSTIFVLDEKSWGPYVRVDDVYWETTNRDYHNPLDRTAYLARKISSWLKNNVEGYEKEIGRRHIVAPGAVLSHDSLDLFFTLGRSHDELVLALADGVASNRLIEIDGYEPEITENLRNAVVVKLSGLNDREAHVRMIGQYKIEGRMNNIGRAERYIAYEDDEASEIVILLCYPLDGWGDTVDMRPLFRREARSLKLLGELGRAPVCLVSFEDENYRLFVTPIRWFKRSRNLRFSVQKNDPVRVDGRVDIELAIDVVTDSFKALADIHSVNLVHRALEPRRIFIDRQMKIRVSDFLLAKISGDQTILPWIDDFDGDESVRFRAPEIIDAPQFAGDFSDVYSMALCLSLWLLNESGDSFDPDEIKKRVNEFGGLGDVLVSCLAENPAERPSANTAVELLSNIGKRTLISESEQLMNAVAEAESSDLFVGKVLRGKFKIERSLGKGASATAWLAKDLDSGSYRVVKKFSDDVPLDKVREQHHVAETIVHDNCARVFDLLGDPERCIVNEYVEGESLDVALAGTGVADDVAVQELAEKVRSVALDVLKGLAYMHERNFVHVDVSPRNIIVTPNGRAKLIDFGMAGDASGVRKGGTPTYMAPEIFAGTIPNSVTDLHSFASSFLHVMLGRSIFDNDTAMSKTFISPTIAEKQMWGPLGTSLLEVLSTGVAREPTERPRNAQGFAESIRMAIGVEVRSTSLQINPYVDKIRGLYRSSVIGNEDMKGLDSDFAQRTYLPTRLDTDLLPLVLQGKYRLVVLTGNPGDGKTSFLQTMLEHLKSAGAKEEQLDHAGWTYSLSGRRFTSVYDASESNGGLSSDEMLNKALAPLIGPHASSHTVLVAANDGRLLQFFADFDDEYEEIGSSVRDQLMNGTEPNEYVVIDLKVRSMAGASESTTFGDRVLQRLIDEEFWGVCNECSAQDVCPIYENRVTLHGPGGEAVKELVEISHLRRNRRATVRDLRSSLAWLITGDRGCKEVHEAIQNSIDLKRGETALAADLAFTDAGRDYLISEWALLDPSRLPLPELERAARNQGNLGSSTDIPDAIRELSRRVFFRDAGAPFVGLDEVRVYRHFEYFRSALYGMEDNHFKKSILLGMSRVVGAKGFDGSGLAITSSEDTSNWVVLRVIDSDEFEVSAPKMRKAFVENMPDLLELRHRKSARPLSLTLDVSEVLLRAANGELVNDIYSDAVRLEIEGFANQMKKLASNEVQIIDSGGSEYRATRGGSDIRLENV